jgi:transposase, IS5 family
MRKRFEPQLSLNQVPIEKVIIPLKSRDELPPILAGLQWIWQNPAVKEPILALVEEKVSGGKKATGRPGLHLWQIVVLGVVRLGLDCDYDRLEYLANYDSLLRQILGVSPMLTADEKPFHHKTLSDNVCHVDEDLLRQINALVVQAGRPLFKKKADGSPEPLEIKVDTYVLETNVHFPTDLNLLWDAQRKCLDLIEDLEQHHPVSGWRKAADWHGKLKGQMRQVSRAGQGGGKNKEARVKAAAHVYVASSYTFESKVFTSLLALRNQPLSWLEEGPLLALDYFHSELIRHLDLVERRLLHGETIAHAEKVFSLFEPHTEWIAKGKLFPSVELGHRLLVATDQHELIVDYQTLEQTSEVDALVPLADRLLGRYGSDQIASLSTDQGFSRTADRELLELYISQVVIPKRGKLSEADQARQSQKTFRALRHQHAAVESDIHCLEHHGLNRCPDKGWPGYQRYAGFGVLAYNLHKIGARVLATRREELAEENQRKAAA